MALTGTPGRKPRAARSSSSSSSSVKSSSSDSDSSKGKKIYYVIHIDKTPAYWLTEVEEKNKLAKKHKGKIKILEYLNVKWAVRYINKVNDQLERGGKSSGPKSAESPTAVTKPTETSKANETSDMEVAASCDGDINQGIVTNSGLYIPGYDDDPSIVDFGSPKLNFPAVDYEKRSRVVGVYDTKNETPSVPESALFAVPSGGLVRDNDQDAKLAATGNIRFPSVPETDLFSVPEGGLIKTKTPTKEANYPAVASITTNGGNALNLFSSPVASAPNGDSREGVIVGIPGTGTTVTPLKNPMSASQHGSDIFSVEVPESPKRGNDNPYLAKVIAPSSPSSTISKVSMKSEQSSATKRGKRGKEIVEYNVDIPQATGYNNRQAPKIEIKYTVLGNKVIASFNLLNRYGTPHYAFKHQFVGEILGSDFPGWEDKAKHPAFENARIYDRRKFENGANVPRMDNGYLVRGLCMTFNANPAFEDVGDRVTKLATILRDLLQTNMFESVYLKYIKTRFSRDTMYKNLKNGNHDLWKCLDDSILSVISVESLDTLYMDDDIAKFVEGVLRTTPVEKWPLVCVKKLFKGGVFPEDFQDRLIGS